MITQSEVFWAIVWAAMFIGTCKVLLLGTLDIISWMVGKKDIKF